ncbi:M4 family metallopeptidase [Staphylococcus xylosus]|uniref:M4 family metallopeptidase n=1 Tax=Staphylococcus xylosus TaxID=1288 RepID=UPI002DBA6098|nr:M4 family metallopeptidase [Staphylococcus xylosus]MEB7385050.1 M4 family metallopeptidase [Staphylococcus xylosus]MEB7832577.1 M4 family metallopeptidase [Staphylococcus xylosus]
MLKKIIFTVVSCLLLFSTFEVKVTAKETDNNFSVLGKGINLKNEEVEIPLFQENGIYYLFDKLYNGNTVIQVLDSNNKVYSNDKEKIINDKKAVTVYQNIHRINEEFENKFNRKGIKNMESIDYQNIAITNEVPNSLWTGSAIAINPKFTPSLDILAHEYTHGIIQNEVKNNKVQVFQNEAGAIEESLGDSFAVLIDGNFTINEEAGSENIIRSLSNPQKYKQPANYKNYIKTEEDNGGVHVNSGIPNFAFYKTFKKIGDEKTAKIYYKTLVNDFDANSNFKSFSKKLEKNADDLYSNKEASIIAKIWKDIGVN